MSLDGSGVPYMSSDGSGMPYMSSDGSGMPWVEGGYSEVRQLALGLALGFLSR